jgi:hypothetical protein
MLWRWAESSLESPIGQSAALASLRFFYRDSGYSGRPWDHLQDAAAELGEGALAAGKDYDLLIACLPVQSVEHLLDAVVIRIYQRIVQNDWRRLTVPCQEPRKGQPR